MNLISISGIILIALGTLLTIWGSSKESQKSQNAIEKQIEETKLELSEALQKVNKDTTQKEISDIQLKFQNWAEKFHKQKRSRIEIIKAESEKMKGITKSTRLNKSQLVRPLFDTFYNNIKIAVNVYNDNTNVDNRLKMNISAVPNDLYYDSHASDISSIHFKKDFGLYFFPGTEFEESKYLGINLYFFQSEYEEELRMTQPGADIGLYRTQSIIIFDPDSSKFTYQEGPSSYKFELLSELFQDDSLKNFKSFCPKFIQSLIELGVITAAQF